MPRKRSNRSPEIIAGKLKRAYSGERLLRLRKAIQKKMHESLNESRDAYRAASEEVTRATTRKIGVKSWESVHVKAAKEIRFLRAHISHAEALRDFFRKYLDFYGTFKNVVKFNEKRVKSAREAVEELTFEMSIWTERLVRLSRKRRKEKEAAKRSFRMLFLRISRQKKASERFKELKQRVDQEQEKLVAIKKQSFEEIEQLQELLSEGKIPLNMGFRPLKKDVFRKLNAQRAAAAEAEENLWIFLHGFARKFMAKEASPRLFEELARRRHNATEEKIQCLKRLRENR